MYRQHFGLKELPFTLAPDPAYYFNDRSHHQALNVLLVALRSGEGFVKITGEVGTGKTLLCRKLLGHLPASVRSAYIPNPLLSPAQLFRAVALELGLKVPERASSFAILDLLQKTLLTEAAAGRRVVVCIDEAQAMPDSTLEALRLLSNLETEKRKLLQIVLFGQPELDERLATPGLRQLRQRIGFSHRLAPLSPAEVAGYVGCRLKAAGAARAEVFRPRALRRLHRESGGVPRLVNILAHKALMAAYGEGAEQVTTAHVAAAAEDTEGLAVPRRWPTVAAGVLALAVAAVAAVWAMGWLGRGNA